MTLSAATRAQLHVWRRHTADTLAAWIMAAVWRRTDWAINREE